MSSIPADLRATQSPGDQFPGVPLPATLPWRARPGAIYSVGLWVFMGVATTLFALFLTAYVMRMGTYDATAIVLPWQLWLSSAWLVAGSLSLQRASLTARLLAVERVRPWLLLGGVCALVFITTQWWAWESLLARQVSLSGNPAGSLFYLLTAMHMLHVAGGLVAWTVAWRALARREQAPSAEWRTALLARYWHFLLLVWLVLFAAMSWITPEVARIICRTA